MPDRRTNRVRRFRSAAAASSPSKRPAPGWGTHAKREWQISDDLPRPTPVGRAEIETLEVYLGGQIDDILRRMRA
jgi:hypothetical protein